MHVYILHNCTYIHRATAAYATQTLHVLLCLVICGKLYSIHDHDRRIYCHYLFQQKHKATTEAN